MTTDDGDDVIDAALRAAVARWLSQGGRVIDGTDAGDGIDALRATLGHIIDGDVGLRDALAAAAGTADNRPTKRGGGKYPGGSTPGTLGDEMKRTDDGRDGRDAAGRWAPGNPGGPGRPRRAVESDYMRALTDRVTPDVWRDIIDAVVDAARAGDMRAVAWLSRYLLGATPPTLFALAVADAAGPDVDVDAEIRHVIERAHTSAAARVIDDTDAPPVVMLGPHIRDAG